jgi:hypothetical protein
MGNIAAQPSGDSPFKASRIFSSAEGKYRKLLKRLEEIHSSNFELLVSRKNIEERSMLEITDLGLAPEDDVGMPPSTQP